MAKRALIIEDLPCHQEIIPTWVWALTANGYIVTVRTRAPAHRSIITEMRDNMKLRFDEWSGDTQGEYDIVINNTLYPDGAVQNLSTARVYSVLHKLPEPLTAFADWRGLSDTRHTTLALGQHVYDKLASELPAALAPPVYFGELDDSIAVPPASTFLVQGTLERFRRNYDCIVDLANAIERDDYKFVVLGDGNARVIHELRARLQQPNKLQAIIGADYTRYFAVVRGCKWVMPCIDETFKHGYFDTKITSSVMLAIGHSKPLLLHAKLAAVYGLVDGHDCLTYDGVANLADAFERALAIDDVQYAKLAVNTRAKRKEMLQCSLNAF